MKRYYEPVWYLVNEPRTLIHQSDINTEHEKEPEHWEKKQLSFGFESPVSPPFNLRKNPRQSEYDRRRWVVVVSEFPGPGHLPPDTECCLQYLPCQHLSSLWLASAGEIDYLGHHWELCCADQCFNECRYEREREIRERTIWIMKKMWACERLWESNNAALSGARLPGEVELPGGSGPALPSHHQTRSWCHTIRNNNSNLSSPPLYLSH